MRLWVRWSVWLCLSLMLWTAAAESTHTHPNRTESGQCTICVVAHSASPTVMASQGAPAFTEIGLLRDQNVAAKAQLSFSAAGIRGPPVVL